MTRFLLFSLLFVLMAFTPVALASDPSALMIIFIPGLVFLAIGVLAISYALTTSIEHYWLQLGLRIFSVAIVLAPTHINGAGYWWPNAIGVFFNEHFSFGRGIMHAAIITLILLFLWRIVKKPLKV